MTKYQEKRRLLNKINARTRSMSKKYDIDRQIIADKAIEGLDGVYVDEEFGTINITPGFESDELYEALEKAVLTNIQAEEKAMKSYEDFIGPLPVNTAKKEVKAMYEFEDEVEDLVDKYYELQASVKNRPWTASDEYNELEAKLKSLGSDWHDKVPFSVLQDTLDKIKEIKI